jgi:nucleoside-diphosphate-sugar epimerase
MNIFIAGGTGAIGRVLIPLLVHAGHRVVALTRSADRTSQLEQMGAVPVVGDVYDRVRLARLLAESKAEVVVQQLTAFGTKDGDPYAETARVRTDGTRNLVSASRAAQVRRFIAQSISFICSPSGSGVTDEETPLHLNASPAVRAFVEAVASLEQQTLEPSGMAGTVLRYGWFYGPGTSYDPEGAIPSAIRKGSYPIVGVGAGTYSFINLRDAAVATVRILSQEASGIYNIVDDSPIRLSEWLPLAAKLLDAPAPGHMDEAAAREKLGDVRVYYMNEQRGASNAKAKRQFNWQPAFPSCRTGFEALYLNRPRGSVDASHCAS